MNSKMTEKEFRAGWEFAPEPPRLPCGKALSVEQMAIVVERCNAYPGLRKAANDLLSALGESRGRQVENSARTLGLELAQGPKP